MDKTFAVKDRVLYTALVNNPGHYKPGEKIPGTVVAVFGQSAIYRIELDRLWNERVIHSVGKKIIVGNVSGRCVSELLV